MFPKRRHFLFTRRGTTQKKIIFEEYDCPDCDVNTSGLFVGNIHMIKYQAKAEQTHCFVQMEQSLKTSTGIEACFM
jgi:hypothetical protein